MYHFKTIRHQRTILAYRIKHQYNVMESKNQENPILNKYTMSHSIRILILSLMVIFQKNIIYSENFYRH
jgi:hypothetical protein